ncbi:receptor for retinol uptake stra6 isoform X2 [Narcine bancroftii]|uniref:receptor for retinol uptake stra6 isoform X2 n=1 Tax=Narcine bancroftii TaxID=1343680 RepID=UPI003831CE81
MDPSKATTSLAEMDDMDYSDWYIDDDHLDSSFLSETLTPCNPIIQVDLFHICAAGASVAVLVFLSLFVKRRRLCKGCCAGVPGLLHPASFLENDCNRGIAAAVFGVLFCTLCAVVIDSNPLPIGLESSKETKEYKKIIAMLFYPVMYYPLIACAAMKNKVSYLFGSLLSWLHCGVLIWQRIECPLSLEMYKYYSLLRSLPQLLCLGFLSVVYPILLLRDNEMSRNLTSHWCQPEDYYTDYLKLLLRKRPSENSVRADRPSLLSKMGKLTRSWIYIPTRGFRIPPKLTVSMTVALITIYQVALLLVVNVVPTLQKMRAGVREEISYVLEGFGINLSDERAEVLKIVKHYFWIFEVCYILAVSTSCCFTLFMLMRSMVLHRENLQTLYRGDTYKVFKVQKHIKPSQSALVSWMSFTSYQAAYVALGFLFQLLMFFSCFLILAFLVAVPIIYGKNLFLFKILERMWPFWLALIVVLLIQHLLARFFFLLQDGKSMNITNSVFIGTITGVWRMVLLQFYNVIHFCRLDLGLLNQSVEQFDPGYRCYTGFLLLEVSQSHPVVKAFCSLLLRSQGLGLSGGDESKNEEEGIQLVPSQTSAKTTRSKRMRARWFLTFTLLNNPGLISSRKAAVSSSTDLVTNGELNSPSKHATDPEGIGPSELATF